MFGRYVVVLAVSVVLVACGDRKAVRAQMDKADSLMQCHPDSALAILQGINASEVSGKKDKARYALLTSMALDKNYIDTTEFDVLQPAIDYYLEHGTPDERLRTYYYQGRIYNNREEDDSAMSCFLRAAELKGEVTDTLTLAHNYVMQASLCVDQYKTDEIVQFNMAAAQLYESIGNDLLRIKSLCNAINGYIVLGNQSAADSLIDVCIPLMQKSSDGAKYLFSAMLSYNVDFGTPQELKAFLAENQDVEMNIDQTINFARGYLKICEYDKAMNKILEIRPAKTLMDSMRYNIVRIDILEKQGKYQQAFKDLKDYTYMLDRQMSDLFTHDLLFAEKKHQFEMDNVMKSQAHNKVIRSIIYFILGLIVFVGWLCYHSFWQKTKRRLAEKENENLILEQERLKLLILQLEGERDTLKDLQQVQKDLAKPIQEAIKLRFEMLNGLLAKEITNDERYAKSYYNLVESIHHDKKTFLDATRAAFIASYPKFMAYLEQHGLTADEINYVCLYAMRLRGKDVGEYMQRKRHYIVSSEIRKKLGMDEHKTNIGPYIRKLMEELD